MADPRASHVGRGPGGGRPGAWPALTPCRPISFDSGASGRAESGLPGFSLRCIPGGMAEMPAAGALGQERPSGARPGPHEAPTRTGRRPSRRPSPEIAAPLWGDQPMLARDVMATGVATIAPNAPLHAVAATMVERGV